MNKQQQIQQIIDLMTGKISAKDIEPRMVIHFDEPHGNTYLINNKKVSKDEFHKYLRTLPAIGHLETTGRINNMEEYYYD